MQTIKPARKRGPTLVSWTQVYQVIVDNFCANPSLPSSRQDIARELCVPPDVVDPHIKRLKEKGIIHMHYNGVFRPSKLRPDRAISYTHVPGADSVFEMGDAVLQFSPGEARKAVELLGGIMLKDVVGVLREVSKELTP